MPRYIDQHLNIFSKGSPLLLCTLIALLDKFGSCDLILPSMGVAQCFLGYPWGDQWQEYSHNGTVLPAFFYTPEFIYFHLILLLLQVANVFFFVLTIYFLADHWRTAAVFMKRENRKNFLIVVKLFFIMGE